MRKRQSIAAPETVRTERQESQRIRRRKILLWLGICTLISLAAVLLSQNEIYLDDWYIEACADGAFGANNRSLMVLGANFLITGMIYLFSLTGLRLFWLHWILLAMNYGSYLMVGWILFDSMEWKRASFFTALYGIIMAPLVSFEFQFTTTAAIAMAAGCAMLLYSMERQKKCRWQVFSIVWIVVGCGLRFDCVYYSVAFFGIVWLKKLISALRGLRGEKLKMRREVLLRLVPFVTALVLCIGVECAQHVLMGFENPGFYDWNKSRTMVDDYAHPEYFSNEEAYEELGVSYNDYLLLCSWNNQDPDFFSQELYDQLAEIEPAEQAQEEDTSLLQNAFEALLGNDFLWIALLGAVAAAILFDWGFALTIGGMLLAAAVFYVYFCMIGRLIWRTEWPIWINFITAMAVLFAGENMRMPEWKLGRARTAGVYGIVAVLVLFAAPLENMQSISSRYSARMESTDSIGAYLKGKLTGEEMQYATYNRGSGDYFSSRKENFYFCLWANNWLQQYPVYAVDTLRFIDVGAAENWGSLGQYVGHLTPMQQNLKHYGIDNPIRDLVHNNVRVAVRRDECVDRTKELLCYLREHYYEDVTFCVDEVLEDAVSGRFLSGKPTEHSEKTDGEPVLTYEEGSDLYGMDTITVDASEVAQFDPETDEGYLVLTNQSGTEYTYALMRGMSQVVLYSDVIAPGESYEAKIMFQHNGVWYRTDGDAVLERSDVTEETFVSNLDLTPGIYNNRAAVNGYYDWEDGFVWTQQYSSVSLYNFDIERKGLELDLYFPQYPNMAQEAQKAQPLEIYVNGVLVKSVTLEPGEHRVLISAKEIENPEDDRYIVEMVCPYYVNPAEELGKPDTRNVSVCVTYIGEAKEQTATTKQKG